MVQVEGVTVGALLSEVERIVKKEMAGLVAAPTPEREVFVSRQQVADMFSVTLPTVHAWMNAGILKPYKIGNKTRFLLHEVKAAAIGARKGGGNE